MTIESRASLIVISRLLINLLSFMLAFGIMVYFIVITNANQHDFLFIGFPLYALSSTLLDWASSKLNTKWYKNADPNFILKKQGVNIAELRTYLALVLKFRLMRIGIGGAIATIALIFSFYPIFIFAFIYLASFIATLCYFYVMDIKIPEELRSRPSSNYGTSDLSIENNPAIIGTAANSIRRHS